MTFEKLYNHLTDLLPENFKLNIDKDRYIIEHLNDNILMSIRIFYFPNTKSWELHWYEENWTYGLDHIYNEYSQKNIEEFKNQLKRIFEYE